MDELIRLSDASLSELPEGVDRPGYDRSALQAGIVHVGLGNFHRAHQAWYLHRLMQQGEARDWAIIGAGVRSADAAMRDKLLAQDCLTTLIELDPAGKSAEVTGPMIDFVPIVSGNGPLIEAMADPAIRIVAMTVTEGGYYLDPVTRGFAEGHDDIRHDAQNPGKPRTVFGAMVEALRRRRSEGHGPFTGLSCDNLPGNGSTLRQTVTSLARMTDPDLADWIEDTCSFPDSMVDCIVPATGPRELVLVQTFGIDDHAPVTHENYRQWVIEDNFCAGRPAWELAGATFTDRVHEYEAMKLRMLNGGHQCIANAGELLGVDTIAKCMAHPLVGTLFRKVVHEEIAPHVRAVPGISPQDYADLIDRRFSNPEIHDTTRRVAFDGSSRHTGALLPVVRDALAEGTSVEGLALVQALWARMCEGTREDGSIIEPNDPFWDDRQKAAKEARERPDAWLEQQSVYGDIAKDERFSVPFKHWLKMLWSGGGTSVALESYLKG